MYVESCTHYKEDILTDVVQYLLLGFEGKAAILRRHLTVGSLWALLDFHGRQDVISSLNRPLHTLVLEHVELTDEHMPAVAEFVKESNSVHELSLGHNDITVRGIYALGRALLGRTSVHVLRLGHNKIGEAGAVHLAEVVRSCPDLITLDLSSNCINLSTDHGYAFFMPLRDSNLRELWQNI